MIVDDDVEVGPLDRSMVMPCACTSIIMMWSLKSCMSSLGCCFALVMSVSSLALLL